MEGIAPEEAVFGDLAIFPSLLVEGRDALMNFNNLIGSKQSHVSQQVQGTIGIVVEEPIDLLS
ncbi:MAG: hypothetical protein HY675_10600 [Chloroflexi bacterium]|nr:hypothetical protein [Chloroflexota bacterium]